MHSWNNAFLIVVSILTASALGDETVRHRFLCVDNARNLLIFVDQVQPDRSWTTPIPAASPSPGIGHEATAARSGAGQPRQHARGVRSGHRQTSRLGRRAVP